MRRLSHVRRARRFRSLDRPSGVWLALVVGIVGVLAAVGGLLAVIGLNGAAEGFTAGALDVPLARIVVIVVVGYLVAAVLLVVAARSRATGRTWLAAVGAALVALVVSAYPLFAVAAAAVGQAQDVLPWIADLVQRVVG